MKPTLKRIVYKRGERTEQIVCYGASARGSRFVIGSKAYKTDGLSKKALFELRTASVEAIMKEHAAA